MCVVVWAVQLPLASGFENPATPSDALTPLGTFWDPLLQRNYIQSAPKNPMQNGSSSVGVAPAAGVGWAWYEGVAGQTWSLGFYAVDVNGLLLAD